MHLIFSTSFRCPFLLIRMSSIFPWMLCISFQFTPRFLTCSPPSLPYRYQLTTLNLEGNRLGDNNVITLCRGLLTSVTVTSLNLSGCLISDRGAVALGEVIRGGALLKVGGSVVGEGGILPGVTAAAQSVFFQVNSGACT